MSTRPVSPPPIVRWPFVLGDVLCFAVAALVLLLGDSPPGVIHLVVFTASVLAGIGLLITPYLKEHEARTRLAEAQARESAESHVRRLGQIAEQLTNAVSRSQSTEEQVGQALGTLEELTEKLTTQAEELAQNLARSHEREIASLKAEVDRHASDRDQRLDLVARELPATAQHVIALEQRWSRANQVTAQTLEDLKERLIALAGRLDHPRSDGPKRVADEGSTAPSSSTQTPVSSSIPTTPASSAESSAPAVTVSQNHPPMQDAEPRSPDEGGTARALSAQTSVSAETTGASATATAPARPRVRRAPAHPTPAAESSAPTTAAAPSERHRRLPAKPQPMELPLLDLEKTQEIATPTAREQTRVSAGATSTLVATAYIGIGNKLFVRGDGPGLSWDQGVPMQFLAIGKWGWTSPEAAEPITCRIYRNDETPMLDENIVIAPGARAEVTPRF